MATLKFPEGFLWGASVSSYQVEGGIEQCDWSKEFPAGKACDYYNNYEKFFNLAQELNHNTHRLSLEWSRVEPREGEFDEQALLTYKYMLQYLHRRKIKTFVTLWHFTLPLWMEAKGGWLSPEMPQCLARYAKKCAEVLGDEADFWITINEPMIYTTMAYVLGEFPPREKSAWRAMCLVKSFPRVHGAMYDAIKEVLPQAQVGWSENYSYIESYDKNFLARTLTRIWDYIRNGWLLDRTKDKQDFLGVNYYFHDRVKFKFRYPYIFVQNVNKQVSDIGTEIYPKGLYYVLKKLSKYNKPIYITENGIADAEDKKRTRFIKDHLFWTHKAIGQGADVRGYLHWSLVDNFEWQNGFSPRFGLVKMDYETLTTTVRGSAQIYAQICSTNQLEM